MLKRKTFLFLSSFLAREPTDWLWNTSGSTRQILQNRVQLRKVRNFENAVWLVIRVRVVSGQLEQVART